jgi:hypothetical protein
MQIEIIEQQMVAKIDIDDLRKPILTPVQKAAMEAAEANPVILGEEAVLEAARTATGLSDFGADDFRPRLRLWLSEGNADRDLSALGRSAIFGLALTYASNRLRIEDMVKRHPQILDLKIERPIVIAGLPRSGTTHLQNFASADPRLRKLPMWEAIAPVPGPQDAPTTEDPNPRRTRAFAAWAQLDALLPYMKNIHEMSPDYVSEDIELQCLDFGSYYIEWRALAPRWRDYYFATDYAPVYQYMKRALQVLTFLRGPDRWVLKCPQHMEQLIALFKVFPDATAAITHRDPVASILSAVTGICYGARLSRKRIDADQLMAYWIDRFERLLRAFVRDHDRVPANQVVDVHFDKLMGEPIQILEEIYAKAALPFTDEIRAVMQQFLADNPRGKHGQIIYNLKRDFGLRGADIKKRFQFYYDRFPVKLEVD